jgi:hypothetical protein
VPDRDRDDDRLDGVRQLVDREERAAEQEQRHDDEPEHPGQRLVGVARRGERAGRRADADPEQHRGQQREETAVDRHRPEHRATTTKTAPTTVARSSAHSRLPISRSRGRTGVLSAAW